MSIQHCTTIYTINLDCEVIDHFKAQAVTTGIPDQQLINSYLSDYVAKKRQLSWT